MTPTFFATPADFRHWLETHHASEPELWVGFHKVHTGTPSVTWPEAVDEALCVGWIDGVRKSLGADGYVIRFSPRKPTSNWSAVNLKRVPELIAEGRMQPAGLAAYDRRREDKSAIYAYENKPTALEPDDERAFRKNTTAWTFFSGQAPSYQRTCLYWVMSAKRPETRARRLASLIDYSAKRERIPMMGNPSPGTAQ